MAFLWHREQLRRSEKEEGQALLQMSVSKSLEGISVAAVDKENGCTEEALTSDEVSVSILIVFPMLKFKLAGKKINFILEDALTSQLGWDGTHV